MVNRSLKYHTVLLLWFLLNKDIKLSDKYEDFYIGFLIYV